MKNKNYFEKKELVSDNQLCKEKKLARDNQICKEKELVSDKIYLECLANIEDRFLLESWEECTSKKEIEASISQSCCSYPCHSIGYGFYRICNTEIWNVDE